MIFRTVAALLVLLCSGQANALSLIGEEFGQTVYGEAKSGKKINLFQEDEFQKDYHIKWEGLSDEFVAVRVSKITGKVFGATFYGEFTDMFATVAFASSLCEGVVQVPTSAKAGKYELVSAPSGKFQGKTFRFTVTRYRSHFILDVECGYFRYGKESDPNLNPTPEQRLRELREFRDILREQMNQSGKAD